MDVRPDHRVHRLPLHDPEHRPVRVLTVYLSNFQAAVVALTSYTLLILVRNIVAGIDGVPAAVLDAADGMGHHRDDDGSSPSSSRSPCR